MQLRTSLCIAVVADDIVFSADDRILTEKLCKFKNYGAKRLIRELPTKGWSVSNVNKLLKKLRDTGTTARRAGMDVVEVLALLTKSIPLTSWF